MSGKKKKKLSILELYFFQLEFRQIIWLNTVTGALFASKQVHKVLTSVLCNLPENIKKKSQTLPTHSALIKWTSLEQYLQTLQFERRKAFHLICMGWLSIPNGHWCEGRRISAMGRWHLTRKCQKLGSQFLGNRLKDMEDAKSCLSNACQKRGKQKHGWQKVAMSWCSYMKAQSGWWLATNILDHQAK